MENMFLQLLHRPPKDELEAIIDKLPKKDASFKDIANIGRIFDYPRTVGAFQDVFEAEKILKDKYKKEGTLKKFSVPWLGNAIYAQLRRMDCAEMDYNDIKPKQLKFCQEIVKEIRKKIKDYNPDATDNTYKNIFPNAQFLI